VLIVIFEFSFEILSLSLDSKIENPKMLTHLVHIHMPSSNACTLVYALKIVKEIDKRLALHLVAFLNALLVIAHMSQ
jgi:hypothetical protein